MCGFTYALAFLKAPTQILIDFWRKNTAKYFVFYSVTDFTSASQHEREQKGKLKFTLKATRSVAPYHKKSFTK